MLKYLIWSHVIFQIKIFKDLPDGIRKADKKTNILSFLE